jgi:hypothetical protein
MVVAWTGRNGMVVARTGGRGMVVAWTERNGVVAIGARSSLGQGGVA